MKMPMQAKSQMRKDAMRIQLLAGFACFSSILAANEGPLIDDMNDVATFSKPAAKCSLELTEGKSGKAIKFSFDSAASGQFATGRAKGTPEWDKAAGISFWVKGDGSDHTGGIQFIYDNDYSIRYTCSFPISSTDWTRIVIPWRDMISPLGHGATTLDPKAGLKPSKLGAIAFGKWWFWKDYAAHSFSIDDLRLEPTIDLDENAYKPEGDPLARVRAKLSAGKPITIVTMGDSLTDFSHNANVKVNWPTKLKAALNQKFKSEVTIVNPAIGGTELRMNLIHIPRWIKIAPEPDLVMLQFGANDFVSKVAPETFFESQKEAIDRVRRATRGKADILVFATIPGTKNWTAYTQMSAASKKAAAEKNAAFLELEAAFFEAGKENKDQFYVDGCHLTGAGHELVSTTVAKVLEAPPGN
jgi:lysophospholipase L1-like esterase